MAAPLSVLDILAHHIAQLWHNLPGPDSKSVLRLSPGANRAPVQRGNATADMDDISGSSGKIAEGTTCPQTK
jgi:hypothetical protein